MRDCWRTQDLVKIGLTLQSGRVLEAALEIVVIGNMTTKYFLFLFQGLKTGMYYLRTKPAANAIQFTVDKTKLKDAAPAENKVDNMEAMVCSLENPENCVSCGS